MKNTSNVKFSNSHILILYSHSRVVETQGISKLWECMMQEIYVRKPEGFAPLFCHVTLIFYSVQFSN